MTIIYATYTPREEQERGCYFPTMKAAVAAVEKAAIWEVRAADHGEEEKAYRAVMDSAGFERVKLANKTELCTALNNECNTAVEF